MNRSNPLLAAAFRAPHWLAASLLVGAASCAQAAAWQVCWSPIGGAACAAAAVPLGPLVTAAASLALALLALFALRRRARGALFAVAGALVLAGAAGYNADDAWAPAAQQIDIAGPSGSQTLACSSIDPIAVTNHNTYGVQLALTPFDGASAGWPVTGLAACSSGMVLGSNATCGLACAAPLPPATLAAAGTPLTLFSNGPAGTLTITNTSASSTAANVAADFTGTALDGNITQDASTCASVAPSASCTLTFIPGGAAVALTTFPIQGSNTNSVTAQIAVVTLAIGSAWQGGVVYALDPGGSSGGVAAVTDNSTGTAWAPTNSSTAATSDTDGAANTATIVSAVGNGTYAANVCSAYEVDAQGNSPCEAGSACYADWYLPAKDQLNALYTQQAPVGGFAAAFYWSSTEFSMAPTNYAWMQEFSSGAALVSQKSNVARVRCVRDFAS